MPLLNFRHIGHKILAVVGVTVSLGLTATAWFYVSYQERAVLAQNERTMRKLTETVRQNIQFVMMAGHAEMAQQFAEGLKKIDDVESFLILRSDGTEAFKDNATIAEVNRKLGTPAFAPRPAETRHPVAQPGDPHFDRALASGKPVSFYGTDALGDKTLTFFAPVPNLQACQGCHDHGSAVRGVIKLTTSLAQAQADIRDTRMSSLAVLVPALVATLLLTGTMMRRSVVVPIEKMTSAMKRASDGELEQEVPVRGQDELAQMAGSFNTMAHELLKTYAGLRLEQDKLTTIILSAREAIVVTDASDNVVLVNPAASNLLGKPGERIVAEGFMNLFDDPELMERWLAERDGANVPKLHVYNEHVFSVHAARIVNPEGKPVGSAALLRDITEEKRLEEELRRLSNTDGLTNLLNRRCLDESLQKELDRARRYGHPLSVLMFDIDHFKKFNDTYGHDQGDRILIAVAATLKGAARNQDYACRYGGEEFTVILPCTGKEGARVMAERLRHDVERLSIDGLAVTISIGVAEYPEVDATDQADLVEAADAAMYRAKSSGRNRVCVAEEVA